jgi:drug/metabolite transporter (DMT)-like permease
MSAKCDLGKFISVVGLMVVLGWLLFGEKLSPRNAAGIALVLIALFLLRP